MKLSLLKEGRATSGHLSSVMNFLSSLPSRGLKQKVVKSMSLIEILEEGCNSKIEFLTIAKLYVVIKVAGSNQESKQNHFKVLQF